MHYKDCNRKAQIINQYSSRATLSNFFAPWCGISKKHPQKKNLNNLKETNDLELQNTWKIVKENYNQVRKVQPLDIHLKEKKSAHQSYYRDLNFI